MAEKETKNNPKDLVEATPEEAKKLTEEIKGSEAEGVAPEVEKAIKELDKKEQREKEAFAAWEPKTKLGKEVKAGKKKDIDDILENHKKILEVQIVDALLNLDSDLILVGQAKGKFGGGKRRAWRQTQKKTKEGNVLSFSAMAVAGDKKGHVGVGYGKARETLPAREKAVRNAKLEIMKVKLGFESPEAEPEGATPHTIPFKVVGKCGSVTIELMPAPRGTGLVAGDECKKILKLAGVKDVYTRTRGKTKTTFNLARACIDALRKTNEVEL